MLKDLFRALLQRPAPQVPESPARDHSGQPHALVLYKFDRCPYCQHVMQVIEQLQVPLQFKDIQQEPAYRQELIAIGGKAQVPCLLIDGQPMYESREIAAYLRQHYAQP